MKSIAAATMLCSFLAVPIPAAAAELQPAPSGRVEQIGRPQTVGMDQIAPRGANGANAAAARSSQPVAPQVSAKVERGAPARQLTSERGAGPAARQLTSGGRTAQPSQALSRPSDGRTSTVERIAGKDRCDPALRDRTRTAQCANVIETRAAEFVRRDPTPLSPEQRIIMEQQQRERSGNPGGAARRLAASGDDTRSLEAQGLASVVLSQPSGARTDKPAEDPAASDQLNAQINALVNAIINRPAP